MNLSSSISNSYRILVVDDNEAIHADFRKALLPELEADKEFADAEEAFQKVCQAAAEGRP